jgi:hypothetical protein
MKRVTQKIITRHRRRKKRVERKRRNERKNKRQKLHGRKFHSLSPGNEITLKAPEEFDVYDKKSRSRLLKFIESIQRHFRNNDVKKITVNFKGTKRLAAAGTMLFYARLRRLLDTDKRNIVLRCSAPRNDLASQVLEQIGVYKLFRHSCRGSLQHADVIHWRVASGNKIDATQYAHTIEEYEGTLAGPLIEGVFKGLAEAMANVIEHAYPNDMESKGWWVFSQAKDGELSVIMCDLGVGIPQTLPLTRPSLFDRIKSMIGKSPSDSRCIEEAVKDSESRTGKQERGKGLGDIVVAAGECGGVLIYSNRGCYVSRRGKIETHDYRNSLSGTLVCWVLPITKESS